MQKSAPIKVIVIRYVYKKKFKLNRFFFLFTIGRNSDSIVHRSCVQSRLDQKSVLLLHCLLYLPYS